MAASHPIAPLVAVAALLVWIVVAFQRPDFALWVLPAALPWLDFAPWTGWRIVGEYDVLLLGTVAAARARAAMRPIGAPCSGITAATFALLLVASGLSLWRGIADAGGAIWPFDPFQETTGLLNGLRVAKSALYVLLLWPMLDEQIATAPKRAMRRLGGGMLAGLSVVVLAVLWERIAYPGLTDVTTPYRTTALFWEMHVGGAAIDGYLALATPFVAWALHTAGSPRRWLLAAGLALLTAHAALTTFSRGVYLAVAAPLLLLAWWLWGRRVPPPARRALATRALAVIALTALAAGATLASLAWGAWPAVAAIAAGAMALLLARRRRPGTWRLLGGRTLLALLAIEVTAVLVAGSFMNTRLAASQRDLASRFDHWRNGIGLLQTPGEWLFGLGAGRMPANYARFVPERELSGAVRWMPDADGRPAARLDGPKTLRVLAGQYALTQRVPLEPAGPYRLQIELRAAQPLNLAVSVCEMHLLYERNCQRAVLHVAQSRGSWQRVEAVLTGPALSSGRWYAPRLGVFAMTVWNAGASVEIAGAGLQAADGTELLHNRDFAQGLARWFPAAQEYFVPWHIDNLALELLLDGGLAGALLQLGIVAAALHRLLRGAARDDAMAPFLAASLSGALLAGLVGSLMDMPRIGFLLCLLCGTALLLGRVRPIARCSPPGSIAAAAKDG